MKNCIYCNAELLDNAQFCSACGRKQVVQHSQIFRRQGIKEDEFIRKINEWFAQYPYVTNVNCKFVVNHGIGLLVNKYVLDALEINYECLNTDNQNQYGLVALEHFGLMPKKTEALIHEWKQVNPGARVLNYSGGINQRGDAGSLALGGMMATNRTQAYVFFEFNRKYGTSRTAKT